MLYSVFLALLLATGSAAGEPQTRAGSQTVPKTAAREETKKVLVVFGDSLSSGYRLQPGQSYPDNLQRKLDAQGYAWRVVNLGISGDTTMGGVARIETATALKPDLVLLELGGNDGLRGVPLAKMRDNLDQMIVAFKRAGAQVVLAGMTLPPNYGPDYVNGFRGIYTDLATKYKLALLPFLLEDIITKDLRYFQRDGVHPTADGTQIIAETVLRTLKPLLGTAKN